MARFLELSISTLRTTAFVISVQFFGLQRVRHGGERAAEIRKRDAAALARPAVVAGGAPVVILRKYGGAPDGDGAAELRLHALPQPQFAAGHFHGRQKVAVGQRGIAFRRAADADVTLHDLVVRLHLLVRERPVFAVAIVAGRFEIQIAHAVALAPPDQRAPAHDAQPLPGERLACRGAVGILQVVHEPVVVVLHAGVALLLHGPRARDFRRHVAVFQLVGRHVLGEFLGRDVAPGFEQRHLQARFRQALGRPTAGGAGTYHNGVVCFGNLCRLHR